MIGKLTNTKVSVFIYSSLIIGVLLIGVKPTVLQWVGKGGAVLMFVSVLGLNIKEVIQSKGLAFNKEELKIFTPLFIWIFFYVFGLYKAQDLYDIYVVSQLILITSFLFFIYRKGELLYPDTLIYKASVILILINVIAVLVQSKGSIFAPFRPDGVFLQRNTLATSLYYVMIIILIFYAKQKKKFSYIVIFLNLYLIFVANSRAIYVSLIVFTFTYYFWEALTRRKVIYYTLLYSAFIFNLLFILLTIGFFDKMLPEASLLNLYFREFTGGNLDSGRQIIWPGIVDQIGKHIILGSGPGAVPSDFLDLKYSSHNYYLQLTLQTGVLGLSAFIWFATYLWSMFWKHRNVKLVRIVASFFVSIMFHQIFVVSLTQNNMEQAALFWFIIGISLNRMRKVDVSIANKKLFCVNRKNEISV